MRIHHLLVKCHLLLISIATAHGRWIDNYKRYAPDEINKFDEFEEALGDEDGLDDYGS